MMGVATTSGGDGSHTVAAQATSRAPARSGVRLSVATTWVLPNRPATISATGLAISLEFLSLSLRLDLRP